MGLKYEPLGKYVRLIDERNTDMVTEAVLGINIDKYFMPSVANVIGTDLSKYKLLRKGRFACNPMHVGRDGRLPVSRYTEEVPAIVSPAYFMFEIIDENEIEPEYVMLCFRRPDFDRMCWFRTDASVRGGITWDDVCALSIPVPPISVQRKIVHDYQVITDRIELLKKMNNVAILAIQGLRKYWLEDYGPFGGKRPDDWEEVYLTDIADLVSGYSYSSEELVSSSDISMATIKNFEIGGGFRVSGYKGLFPKKKVKDEQYCELFDTIVAHTDLTQGKIIGNAECVLSFGNSSNILISMDLVKVSPKVKGISKFLITAILQDEKFRNHCLQYINGTTVMHLSKDALKHYKLFLPSDYSCFADLNNALERYYKLISVNLNEIELLNELKTNVMR